VIVLGLGLLGAGVYGFFQSGLPNLRIVRHGVLWRSGQPSALGLRVAYWAGVKTIICLRDGNDPVTRAEEQFAKGHGMTFVQNQLRYTGQDLNETVHRFLDVVRDPRAQPVLVHCSRGKERTGVCTAVFRMEFDGWTSEEALREMYALGFRQGTLPELEQYVSAYRPRGRGQTRALATGGTQAPGQSPGRGRAGATP